MSDLTTLEKRKLEKLFGMETGYLWQFSNRTFSEFIIEVTGREIYTPTYEIGGDSKANRFRTFWKIEPNHVVGTVLAALLDLYKEEGGEASPLYEECNHIAQRLMADHPVPDLDSIVPNADGRDFELLARSVRESIEHNEPEAGLDRLHTFVVKYLRVLCEKRGIATDRGKPLHSLFGEYVRNLRDTGLIESEMAERILKSSISILEAFSHVRNDQSFAHDNPTLGYAESLLIFSNVCSSIRFIRTIEGQAARKPQSTSAATQATPEDDLPF